MHETIRTPAPKSCADIVAKADTEAAAMQKGKEPAAGNRGKGKGSKKK